MPKNMDQIERERTGFSRPETMYPDFHEFSDELQTLCGKHDVALIHKPDSIHVLKPDGRLLGRILWAHVGSLGYAPEQLAPVAPVPSGTDN